MWFSMWLTSDVEEERARKRGLMTEQELEAIGKCAMCGKHAEGERNEHLLFKCKAEAAVKVR